ncbi:hypothetical protein PAYE108092_20660 [Paracoccus yeei]
MGGAAGVMAARHQGDVAVPDRHHLVQGPVVGIDALHRPAVPRVQAMVVGLLQIGDAGEIVLVMAVARIGRPVARGGEDLGHQQAVADILRLHGDVVDEAGVRPLAALGQADAVRADAARGMPARAGGRADRDHAVGPGLGAPVLAGGHIQAMRRRPFEDIHAVSQDAPVLPRGMDTGLALDHDQDDLAPAGRLGRNLARPQPVKRKADIAPARRLRGDLVHLAVAAEGFSQQRVHRPVLPRCRNTPEGRRRASRDAVGRQRLPARRGPQAATVWSSPASRAAAFSAFRPID